MKIGSARPLPLADPSAPTGRLGPDLPVGGKPHVRERPPHRRVDAPGFPRGMSVFHPPLYRARGRGWFHRLVIWLADRPVRTRRVW